MGFGLSVDVMRRCGEYECVWCFVEVFDRVALLQRPTQMPRYPDTAVEWIPRLPPGLDVLVVRNCGKQTGLGACRQHTVSARLSRRWQRQAAACEPIDNFGPAP
jgi:hypothetical protein